MQVAKADALDYLIRRLPSLCASSPVPVDVRLRANLRHSIALACDQQAAPTTLTSRLHWATATYGDYKMNDNCEEQLPRIVSGLKASSLPWHLVQFPNLG